MRERKKIRNVVGRIMKNKEHPSDVWSYRQFGNSVSVPGVEAVFDEFLKRNAPEPPTTDYNCYNYYN